VLVLLFQQIIVTKFHPKFDTKNISNFDNFFLKVQGRAVALLRGSQENVKEGLWKCATMRRIIGQD